MANGAKDSIGVPIVFKNFESKQRTSYMIKLALQKLEEVHWTKIERKLFFIWKLELCGSGAFLQVAMCRP